MLRALLIVLALACFAEGHRQPTVFDTTSDEVINLYRRNRDFCKQHLTTAAVTKVYNDESLIISIHMPSLNVQAVSIRIKYLTLFVHAEKTTITTITHRRQRLSWVTANQNSVFEYVTILGDNMDTRSAFWYYTSDYLKIQIPFKARYTEIAEDCTSRLDEAVVTVARQHNVASGLGDGEPDQDAYNAGSK